MARLPVGKQKLGIGREGVEDLPAEDAVLAISCFEVFIKAEGMDVHFFGQACAQLSAIPTEAGIKDGSPHSAPSKPGKMPRRYTQLFEMRLPR
jgi:hypothetical protein